MKMRLLNAKHALLALASLLLAPAAALHADSISMPASEPSVLLTLCDDLRPDALGGHGSKHVKTPNIHRLTKEESQETMTHAFRTACCLAARGQHGDSW
jgi:hypothetical protein